MFFNLYCHGKLDLKFFSMAGPRSGLEATRIVQKGCTHQRPKLPRKIMEPRVLEKGVLFSCRHICLGKQLLLQMNICCREVMQK